MEYDTENMNSEEIYSSLRGVTEAIQSFSYRSQEDLNEPLRPEGKRDDAVSRFHQSEMKLFSQDCSTETLAVENLCVLEIKGVVIVILIQ